MVTKIYYTIWLDRLLPGDFKVLQETKSGAMALYFIASKYERVYRPGIEKPVVRHRYSTKMATQDYPKLVKMWDTL